MGTYKTKDLILHTTTDGEVIAEMSNIRVATLKVDLIRRGRYITDPALVPPELEDNNILWVDEPPVVTAVLDSGEEIPVYFTNPENQLVITKRVIHPDEEQS